MGCVIDAAVSDPSSLIDYHLVTDATLLARNSRPDTLTPLGRHHPRGLVLPFAVSGDSNAVRGTWCDSNTTLNSVALLMTWRATL